MVASSTNANGDYDWAKEVKAFDETEAGVKGLVDAGVTEIPRFFHHPKEVLDLHPTYEGPPLELPVVDFRGVESGGERRREVVETIRKAAKEWGFFSIVNHGVPLETMDAMMDAVKRFHELPTEEKKAFYTTEMSKSVKLNSNLPVKENDSACWRDILTIVYSNDQLDPHDIPSECRKEVGEYVKYMVGLREVMAELFSEALGLPTDYLTKMECMKSQFMSLLYYPACPEPQKTLGAPKHSDTTVLTLLMQDNLGGLQMLYQNQWVDVPPVRGALIVNFGDLMQMISNGKFISVQHRVVAQSVGARISVASFASPSTGAMAKPFGPIKELVSEEDPAVYREFMFFDYIRYYKSKGTHVAYGLDNYKI